MSESRTPASGDDRADVFISYARADRDQARALAKLLEERGLSVWWDWNLVGGTDWHREIFRALERARKVVVLWSENSVNSGFVLDEAAYARDHGKLVPVAADAARPPLGFGNLHTLSMRDLADDIGPLVTALETVGSPQASVDAEPPSQGLLSTRRLATAVATLFGLGRLPAPGTFGALAALPLAWGLHAAGGIYLVIAATAAIWVLGWWASIEYLAGRVEDPPEVVIDEVAGQLVALWPLSWGLTVAGAEPHVWPWPGWIGGFLLFRFFDIVKPWPVSLANRPGAFPLMMDDIVAGVIAGAIMLLGAAVAHGWF